MTQEQAIRAYDIGAWKILTLRQRAELQINEQFLFMPFEEFHDALVTVLGREFFDLSLVMERESMLEELDNTRKE